MPVEPTTNVPDPSMVVYQGLCSRGAIRDAALGQLHALLLRGARHELGRRGGLLAELPQAEIDDLAHQAAGDAMITLLRKLETFRGDSRFSTWAYKFAIFEAGVKARRRAWRDREVKLDDKSWLTIGDSSATVHRSVETRELLAAIARAVKDELTPRQREVFTALAINEVPIDVLAERMDTTRGALYKTLHDARKKLRAALADSGHDLGEHKGGDR